MNVRVLAHAGLSSIAHSNHCLQSATVFLRKKIDFRLETAACIIMVIHMNKLAYIDRRIKQIKAKLFEIGEMRVGSLTTQKRRWGGEYLQLSYTYKGKGRTQYVRQENKHTVESQIKNYKLFKKLTSEWLELSMQAIVAQEEAIQKKNPRKA